MQTSKEMKKPTHLPVQLLKKQLEMLLRKGHQKNTPLPHNHMNLPTQHRTTTKETYGHHWEQPLTKDLLDS